MRMTDVATQTEDLRETPLRTNELRRFLRVFLSRKVVIFGTAIILILIITAIFAPLFAPYDPYKQNLSKALQGPSRAHLLGTDP
ncbi:MAG: ABC transporter permease, partial [Chlorobiales bacterium]|nr:ABC transporter permease [Chlorobiales bacterium]